MHKCLRRRRWWWWWRRRDDNGQKVRSGGCECAVVCVGVGALYRRRRRSRPTSPTLTTAAAAAAVLSCPGLLPQLQLKNSSRSRGGATVRLLCSWSVLLSACVCECAFSSVCCSCCSVRESLFAQYYYCTTALRSLPFSFSSSPESRNTAVVPLPPLHQSTIEQAAASSSHGRQDDCWPTVDCYAYGDILHLVVSRA